MRFVTAVSGIGLALTFSLFSGAWGNTPAGGDDPAAGPVGTLQTSSIRSANDDTPGTIIVGINAIQYYHLWSYRISAMIYDSDWNGVAGGSWTNTYPNLPAGDYYVMAGRVWEPCEFAPCHPFNPYPDTYYPSSPDREHAVSVHLGPGETKTVTVVFAPREYVCIHTSPQNFTVEGTNSFPGHFSALAPVYVPYYTGNAILFTVHETEPGPLGGTFFFDHWDAGGTGQNCCTVPVGTYMNDFTAYYVLKYRFDPLSDHGRPWGAGWYAEGSTVPFGVESPVIEYTTLIDRSGAVPDTVIADSVMFRFRWWQGTGLGHYTGEHNPSTVTIHGGITEMARWDKLFPLTVRVEDTAMGIIAVDPPGPWQEEDSTISLTAIPGPGFRFVEWDGACSGTEDSAAVVMDTSKTVIARFERSLHPPVIAVPDTAFTEDDTLILPLSLILSWISDPVDPIPSLTAAIGEWSPRLHADMTSWGLGVWADPDWNGEAWISLTVTDPLGSSDTDTVRITVTAVDDPPGPFSLLDPPDSTYIPGMGVPVFRWSASQDPDASNGDRIAYALFAGPEDAAPDSLDSTADTTLFTSVPWQGWCRWTVRAVDLAGNIRWALPEHGFHIAFLSGVSDGPELPLRFDLSRNFPNPFNPGTAIVYSIPERERVVIEIVAMSGVRVRTLVNRTVQPGEYTAAWDGTDDEGRKAGSGVFLCRMKAGRFVKTVKMTILR
jgi:hypothetical protein